MKTLEIGGGGSPVPGMTDRLEEGWGAKPLPFPGGTFNLVYSSHVIEHLPWWEAQGAVDEAFRVLKPGGLLEVHTVDFEYFVKCYRSGTVTTKATARGLNDGTHSFRSVLAFLFGVGWKPESPMWHRGAFDWDYLLEIFERAGFKEMVRVSLPRGARKHAKINLGIRGTKP